MNKIRAPEILDLAVNYVFQLLIDEQIKITSEKGVSEFDEQRLILQRDRFCRLYDFDSSVAELDADFLVEALDKKCMKKTGSKKLGS